MSRCKTATAKKKKVIGRSVISLYDCTWSSHRFLTLYRRQEWDNVKVMQGSMKWWWDHSESPQIAHKHTSKIEGNEDAQGTSNIQDECDCHVGPVYIGCSSGSSSTHCLSVHGNHSYIFETACPHMRLHTLYTCSPCIEAQRIRDAYHSSGWRSTTAAAVAAVTASGRVHLQTVTTASALGCSCCCGRH